MMEGASEKTINRLQLRVAKNHLDSLRVFIICLVTVCAIFSQPLFFSFAGLVGYEYGGAENSRIFHRYTILVFILIALVYIWSFAEKAVLSRAEIGFYVFFLYILSNHMFWVVLDRDTKLWTENLAVFLGIGITGFFAARVIHSFDVWHGVIRLVELIVVFISIGLIVAIVQPVFSGVSVRGIGGASYQQASYYAALCFGLLGLATFRLEGEFRYKICRTWLFTILNIILMLGLFVATIVNGGRGAFLLMMSYLFMALFWISTKGGMTYRGILRFAVVVVFFSVFVFVGFRELIENPVVSAGFNRAVSFLGDFEHGRIDLGGEVGGRDKVYALALRGISESPLIGFGVFGSWETLTHPHNLFLDLAIQFGLPVTFVLVLVVGWSMLVRLRTMDTRKVWLLTISLYPSISLMFSSGYLRTAVFWFVLAGILFIGPSRVAVDLQSARCR
jgi:hypothetical protein